MLGAFVLQNDMFLEEGKGQRTSMGQMGSDR